MTRLGPLLMGLLSVVACTASCTVVDEPGSQGPTRTSASTSASTTTTAGGPTSPPSGTALVCPSIGAVDDEFPADRRAALDSALLASEFAGLDMSVSIWIDGYGEVAAVNPDTRLLPASNQKLFTAMGAMALLDPEHRFTTVVQYEDHTLTVVAGGDPTIRLTGPHSLAALAAQTAAAGVVEIETLGVDADHFEYDRTAVGWQDWHIPDYVGPLSAFTVDDNRHRTDDEFIHGPAVGNLAAFADALAAAGIDTSGARIEPTGVGTGEVVASLQSPPIATLARDMLVRSDNETAEAILREIGGGSTVDGIAAIDAFLDSLCTGRAGQSGDGSGLSRHNLRSAREWRSLLQAAASTSWGTDLREALPVGGRTGTLARRLTGSSTAGNVMAKTGSIIGGQALSGYALTSDGREMVFSVLVNGDPTEVRAARPAIDALVVAAVG